MVHCAETLDQTCRDVEYGSLAAAERARASRPELAAVHSAAVEAATQRYASEAAARTR